MNVERHIFKRVTHFKYLHHLLTQNNDLKTELNTRIKKSNKCYFGLGKNTELEIHIKNLEITDTYMTLIRSLILYVSETWPLRKVEEYRLSVFERKILKRIFGPCVYTQTGEWRKKMN